MQPDSECVSADTARAVNEIGIPPCPRVLAEFMQEIALDEPDLRRMSDLISTDVGLSAAILKTVNSAAYGLSSPSRTILHALQLLGLRPCANLISGLLLRRAFPSLGDPAINAFWGSSAWMAASLVVLGRELGITEVSEAHTFGLFRNCGVPILIGKFFDYGELFMREQAQGVPNIRQLELSRYGVDHAGVGALLARTWRLPDEICEAIRIHHLDDGLPAQTMASVGTAAKLAAAGVIAECTGRFHVEPGLSDYWVRRQEIACAVLSLTPGKLEALQGELRQLPER
jgi:HD-like signal output (HDOD) protein